MPCFYLKNNVRKKVILWKLTLKTVEKDFRPGGLILTFDHHQQ